MPKDVSTKELEKVLTAVLEDGDTIRAVIFTGAPDPDSIGSAIGLKHVIQKKFNGSAEIVVSGEISHPQNKTMLNVLGVQVTTEDDFLSQLHKKEPISTRYNKFIFVDLVPTALRWYKDLPVTVVIDHHKATYENDDAFVQIRPAGSCCTLVWEHLRALGVTFDSDDEESSNVATAMLMGIKTDTSDLLTDNTTELDFQAYAELTSSSNKKHLSAIINYKLPTYYFELKSRLEVSDNVLCEDSFYIGCIGCVTASGRDAIPMLADERLRMEGITTSIIFGFVDDRLVASLRTSNASIDAHSMVQKIFGQEYAGGKQGAAAARVPMGVLSVDELPPELQEKSWAQYRNVIVHRIKKACFGG